MAERITYSDTNRQVWRQAGWVGGSGRLYDMTATGDDLHTEPGWYAPLWRLVDDEPMVEPLAAVRYSPGRVVEVYQASGGNWCIPNETWTRVPEPTP